MEHSTEDLMEKKTNMTQAVSGGDATAGNTAKIIAFQPALLEEQEEPLPDNVSLLSSEKLRRQTFEESTDFFDEAPRRIVGVISSKQIEEAEDYDVIDEIEQQAEKIERGLPPGEDVFDNLKKIRNGVRNAAVHCGYFVTNVRRSLKRRRADKKRRQEEEARRQRREELRQKQRIAVAPRRDANGLVQMRRRVDPKSVKKNRE